MESTEINVVTDAEDQIYESEESKENIVAADYKMVTFSLAGKDYAMDIMKVKEIVKAGRFTYVPNTVPFVLGVYNLRGDIIPIVDLRLFFNIELPERKDNAVENMLIVSVGEQIFGIVVDAIDKVVGIQKSTIQPPHPLFGDISIKYIYGVVESNNRLYILLDIDRIFTARVEKKEAKVDVSAKAYVPDAKKAQNTESVKTENTATSKSDAISAAQTVEENATEPVVAEQSAEKDLSFVIDELKALAHFSVTQLNDSWVKSRFSEWITERGAKGTQLQNEADATEFTKSFWSRNSGKFWDKAYADEIYACLPENNAKQIVVWNLGCGKGMESFSLACLLKKRYSDAKIRIYAHDIDLLSVSNAPLISIPDSYAEDWYSPYVTKKANGEYGFTQEIKDIIMFEYHDCVNSNALPLADIIFARDILSLLSEDAQVGIVSDFEEKLKGNGIVILGDNETLSGVANWNEKTVGSVTYYMK